MYKSREIIVGILEGIFFAHFFWFVFALNNDEERYFNIGNFNIFELKNLKKLLKSKE